ncbi:hypothetical protein AB0M28_22300 [Streptomyces sp. NPDC051940]|uniref:hypothetical protein n=1 Tax=Streptomyces sp. NPDC051940 TaxID=3155675 RepID=UPI0034387732
MPPPAQPDAVLKGLAVNPALPAELLPRLLANPAAREAAARHRGGLTAELAESVIEGGGFGPLELACNDDLPAATVQRLAHHPDASARGALARRGYAAEVFDLLVADADPRVRESLAANSALPPRLRARLADDPAPAVRATLGQWWTDAPEEIRRRLLTDPEPEVRAGACARYFRKLPHPVPPADLHPALLADEGTRAGVVPHLDLTPETAGRLVTDPDPEVREALASHPRLPSRLRDVLAGDPHAVVRAEVFARGDTPAALREALYAGISEGAARARPNVFDCAEDDMWCLMAVGHLDGLTYPWAVADPLAHLGSPCAGVRRSLAASAELPPAAVERLLDDDDFLVRWTMARRAPAPDPDVVERVERRHPARSKVRGRPADDFDFPGAYLRRFATDPDPRIRTLAPRDPGLPTPLADRLAADPDPRVRRAVAAHPRLSRQARHALLGDDDARVAEAAGADPALSGAEIEHLLSHTGL